MWISPAFCWRVFGVFFCKNDKTVGKRHLFLVSEDFSILPLLFDRAGTLLWVSKLQCPVLAIKDFVAGLRHAKIIQGTVLPFRCCSSLAERFVRIPLKQEMLVIISNLPLLQQIDGARTGIKHIIQNTPLLLKKIGQTRQKQVPEFLHNHRKVELGSDRWRSHSPTALLKAGSTRESCSGSCPVRFWLFPRQRLHNFPGSLLQCLTTLTVRSFFLSWIGYFFFYFCMCPLPVVQVYRQQGNSLLYWTVGLDAWLSQEWVKSKCQT